MIRLMCNLSVSWVKFPGELIFQCNSEVRRMGQTSHTRLFWISTSWFPVRSLWIGLRQWSLYHTRIPKTCARVLLFLPVVSWLLGSLEAVIIPHRVNIPISLYLQEWLSLVDPDLLASMYGTKFLIEQRPSGILMAEWMVLPKYYWRITLYLWKSLWQSLPQSHLVLHQIHCCNRRSLVDMWVHRKYLTKSGSSVLRTNNVKAKIPRWGAICVALFGWRY